MKYTSTRSKEELNAAEAIVGGLAPDGGLFVPHVLPETGAEFVISLTDVDYQERAVRVLEKFLTDYSHRELVSCVAKAYGGKFDSARVAPVVELSDATHVLELWHGPTSAFKDMALQLLPQLMSVALKKTGEKREVVILVATSGDTGKAALEGFKDVDQTRIAVFYPQEGVSRMQRLQMVTQEGGNVDVIAVEGNFDDAQTGVKRIFGDLDFNKKLQTHNFLLSSANSINWGRLVPQIVYYFSAYADLLAAKAIHPGETVNFAVPTGNFGNILAGYYAKRMGLPVGKLICASNANNVLTDFLRTGVYNKNRPFYKTNTPSMDILVSSNLERLLYHMSGEDSAKISTWMEKLRSESEYTVDAACMEEIRSTFWADWIDENATLETIRRVYDRKNYVMDTHTAVACRAGENYRQETGDLAPLVVVSTASPYKFNESVLEALGEKPSADADEFALLEALEKCNAVPAPKGLASLRTAKVLHRETCEKDHMPTMLLRLLGV